DSIVVNMMVTGFAIVTAPGNSTQHATQVQGMTMPDQMMNDSLLLAGRFFNAAEGMSGAPVVTINQRLAADFIPQGRAKNAIGDTLFFQGQPRVVIGVLRAMETDRARRAIMPSRAVAGAVATGVQSERPPQLVVTSPTIEGVAPTRVLVEKWAASRFGG